MLLLRWGATATLAAFALPLRPYLNSIPSPSRMTSQ